MSLLKENQLPMSELLTALKYVRILNDSLNPGHGIQDPPIVPVPEVAPPPFDWDEKEDQPMIRQLWSCTYFTSCILIFPTATKEWGYQPPNVLSQRRKDFCFLSPFQRETVGVTFCKSPWLVHSTPLSHSEFDCNSKQSATSWTIFNCQAQSGDKWRQRQWQLGQKELHRRSLNDSW